MSGLISGNMVGSYSQIGKTFILTDENGTELTGVVVGQETIFTATDNDVREGLVYASDGGVSIGTKFIPPYNTVKGTRIIPSGSVCKISMDQNALNLYDYTFFQCIVCLWNTNMEDSVAAEKVAIEDTIYSVQSTTAEAVITKDSETQTIELGFTNNTSNIYVLRYVTYKEIE